MEIVNGVRCWRCVRKTYPRCHFAKFDCHWVIGSRQCSNYTWPNRDGTGAVARQCLSTNCGQLMWRNQCKKDPPDCAAGWNKSTGKKSSRQCTKEFEVTQSELVVGLVELMQQCALAPARPCNVEKVQFPQKRVLVGGTNFWGVCKVSHPPLEPRIAWKDRIQIK